MNGTEAKNQIYVQASSLMQTNANLQLPNVLQNIVKPLFPSNGSQALF